MPKILKKILLNPFLYAFGVPFLYWMYLFKTTSMVISCDANLFNLLGHRIAEQGWMAFFTSGNLLEPGFPFLISLSLKLSAVLPLDYFGIQKVFQLSFLLATQVLTLLILNRLSIRRPFKALVVLYLGLSPALVNSALSLFSEIMVYPFFLLIILFAFRSWQALLSGRSGPVLLFGFLTGLASLGAVLLKGIFELIAPAFLLLLILAFILSSRPLTPPVRKRLLALVISFLLAFYGGLFSYKSLNLKHTGRLALTKRGAWSLYGNIARRAAPMDADRIITAAAFVPGARFCEKIRGAGRCRFWSFEQSDDLATAELDIFDQLQVPDDTRDKILTAEAIRMFCSTLPQQVLFYFLEAGKMLFWESTRVGYVSYPPRLNTLFAHSGFNSVLRLLTALGTMISLLFSGVILWKRRQELKNPEGQNYSQNVLLLIILLMIVVYIGSFSFFFTLIRYAFALVPLFLCLMAFTAQSFFEKP